MNIKEFFSKLAQLPGVELAQGDYIPAPEDGAPPNLYVNIIFRDKSPNETDIAFLGDLRKCAACIMCEAEGQLKAEHFNGLCISFFHIPVPGSNIRIYRVYPMRNQIKEIISGITPLDNIEESRHPDLRKLMDKP